MSNYDISNSIENLKYTINLILTDRDTLPEPGSIGRVVEGASVGVTSQYHSQLERNSIAFENLLISVRRQLEVAGEKIEATIKDITTTNESVLDAVAGLTGQLEDVSTPTSVPHPAPGAAGGAAAGASTGAAAGAAAGGVG